MKKRFFSLFVIALLCVTTCIAEQNLFTWENGSVIARNQYIIYNTQLSSSMLLSIENSKKLLHTFSISSNNNQYQCNVQIVGTQGEDEDGSLCYNQFEIRNIYNNNGLIFKKRGTGLPLTTTRWLSCDDGDNNYFRKIDLDNDSYALIFAGWLSGWEERLGEMIIVVVSKNYATLVYDGPAKAIIPTDFDSDSFSMDFITDGTGLIDPETGLLDITPAKLAERTKYRLYKDGNVLKIASWVSGNGPNIFKTQPDRDPI